MDDFDFALKLSNHTSLKRFIDLSLMNHKNYSTILHSQFNYHTLPPVTPFYANMTMIDLQRYHEKLFLVKYE